MRGLFVLMLLALLSSCAGKQDAVSKSEKPAHPECVDGQQTPADDGCNTCICHDGQWSCTEKACGAESSIMGPPKPLASPKPDPECKPGDKKPAEDHCNTCVCRNGYWHCTLMKCLPKKLKTPVVLPAKPAKKP